MTVSCFHIGLAWVPILLSLILASTIYITYFLSTHDGKVIAEFPMISTTGTFPPESCIFAQGLNLCAFLSVICIYIWHQIALDGTSYMGKNQPCVLLRATMVIGVIASLGLSMVGNFQQTEVSMVHNIGAAMAFMGCSIYTIMMAHVCRTYLAYRTIYWGLRLFFGIASILVLVAFFICTTISENLLTSTRPGAQYNRLPSDGGHTTFIVSTSLEWVLGLLLIAFFMSLAPEFRKFAIKLPQVVESTMFKNEF